MLNLHFAIRLDIINYFSFGRDIYSLSLVDTLTNRVIHNISKLDLLGFDSFGIRDIFNLNKKSKDWPTLYSGLLNFNNLKVIHLPTVINIIYIEILYLLSDVRYASLIFNVNLDEDKDKDEDKELIKSIGIALTLRIKEYNENFILMVNTHTKEYEQYQFDIELVNVTKHIYYIKGSLFDSHLNYVDIANKNINYIHALINPVDYLKWIQIRKIYYINVLPDCSPQFLVYQDFIKFRGSIQSIEYISVKGKGDSSINLNSNYIDVNTPFENLIKLEVPIEGDYEKVKILFPKVETFNPYLGSYLTLKTYLENVKAILKQKELELKLLNPNISLDS